MRIHEFNKVRVRKGKNTEYILINYYVAPTSLKVFLYVKVIYLLWEVTHTHTLYSIMSVYLWQSWKNGIRHLHLVCSTLPAWVSSGEWTLPVNEGLTY